MAVAIERIINSNKDILTKEDIKTIRAETFEGGANGVYLSFSSAARRDRLRTWNKRPAISSETAAKLLGVTRKTVVEYSNYFCELFEDNRIRDDRGWYEFSLEGVLLWKRFGGKPGRRGAIKIDELDKGENYVR